MAIMGFLTVEIKGQTYGVEVLPDAIGGKAVRLEKADGTVYEVQQTADRTVCDCPDWRKRHADLPYSCGCKHVQAVCGLGLVENVQPAATIEPEPEISEVSGMAVMPGEIEAAQREAASLAAAASVSPAPVAAPAPAPAPRKVGNLTERYRPRTLADVVGQDEIVYQLREFAAAPVECAMLFSGDTGIGKTSAALALAADLGCDVAREELGGVYTIAAGNQLADDVRETLRSLSLRPLFGSGWKVLIVNECDRMSEAVAYLWLDALENLPAKAVVIFSTNRVDKLPRRFLDRCERHHFKSDADSLLLAAQARVNEIWYQETGLADAPSVADLDCVHDGQVSIRAAVQNLTQHVRRAARENVQDAAQRAAEPQSGESVKPARKSRTASRTDDQSGNVDWHAYGRRYAAGESRSKLAREAGVKETAFWNRMKRLGYSSPNASKFYHNKKVSA